MPLVRNLTLLRVFGYKRALCKFSIDFQPEKVAIFQTNLQFIVTDLSLQEIVSK